MAMIFPGMDPYLEDPQIWSGVHARFVVYLGDQLQPLLRPRYIAAVEERVFVEGPDREIIPDAWIRRDRPEGGGAAIAVADVDAPEIVQVPPLEVHETKLRFWIANPAKMWSRLSKSSALPTNTRGRDATPTRPNSAR